MDPDALASDPNLVLMLADRGFAVAYEPGERRPFLVTHQSGELAPRRFESLRCLKDYVNGLIDADALVTLDEEAVDKLVEEVAPGAVVWLTRPLAADDN